MSEDLPPRLLRLKAFLASAIPCPPEKPHLRQELWEMPLSSVMIHYMTWVDRLIPPRPREVSFSEGFWQRNFTHEQMEAILNIHLLAEQGGDLRPYLSSYVETSGYTGKRDDGRKGIQWADGGRGHKDLALHLFDAHHLHLKPNINGGRKGTSRELLYVRVGRHRFQIMMLGDHNSFNDGSLKEAAARESHREGMTLVGVEPGDELSQSESQRLYRSGISLPTTVNGEVVLTGLTALDGSSLHHIRHADRVLSFLRDWDSKLDDEQGRSEFLQRGRLPARFLDNCYWGFWFGDFCLASGAGEAASLINWRR